ncbi:APC family permease [Pseudonocardia sp. TRM90224]|uniref:APC family permease n=1 Tax=Pseudonocardia sp. TRM90224 TaxID=2812678 RepID=UPI001E621B23|nr:APC family permease [Pseudonocardia sp. TRM90224]
MEHHEGDGLETGHLSRVQIVALALVSYTPAVALATVPFLLVVGAGNGSWFGALIGAAAIGCVGVAVVTFARRYVVTGTLYSYIAHVFGPWARALMGAALLLGYVALIAGVSMTSGVFAGSFLVSIGVEPGLDAGPLALTTTVAMVLAAALAYRGLDTSVRTAVVLTVITLPITLFVTIAVATSTGLALPAQLGLDGSTFGGIVNGVAAAAVFLVAFESSAALAAETRNPKRNVPLAVMSVPIVLGGCYLLATFLQVPGLMAASDALASGMSPAAALAQQAGLGAGFAMVTDGALAVANVASLIAFVNYGSRFVATLATDGLAPRWLAKVHPRHRSPSAAIIALSAVAQAVLLVLVLVWPEELLTGVFPSISTLTVYLWLIPYVLICVGAVVLAVRERKLTPTLAVCALLGAAGMVWVYVNALLNPPPAPVDAMAVVSAVAIVLVFALFLARERISRPSVDAR